MDFDRYKYSRYNDQYDYEFFSEGPRGHIRKLVRFRLRLSNGTPYYNLGFGDTLPGLTLFDDGVVSNNGDAQKVLATVASVVVDFTNNFPDALIYAEGSSLSRTRLYQMGINRNWEEIDLLFEVFGLRVNGGWEPFQKNTIYTGFLAKRKRKSVLKSSKFIKRK